MAAPTGLSAAEVAERRSRYGPNTLPPDALSPGAADPGAISGASSIFSCSARRR